MSVEHIGKGYVKICVSEEELEDSIAGLSQLKPILQAQVMKGNGRNRQQGLFDAAELGKHFDTAIDAMTMLLAGLKKKVRYRMKSKTILGADGTTEMREITVGIHGKGGEVGIRAVQRIAGMVSSLKQCKTPQEVYDRYLQITGYCKCCIDCGFMDEKGADELMCLAAYLAGNEQARAEAQQKEGKKA